MLVCILLHAAVLILLGYLPINVPKIQFFEKTAIDKAEIRAIIPIKPIEIMDLAVMGGVYIWILII